MIEFLKKWKFFVIIAVLILLLFVARGCGASDRASAVESAAKEGWHPVAAAGDFFSSLFDFSSKKAMEQEIDGLKKELAEVKTQSEISEDIVSENEKLRGLLDLKETYSTEWVTIAADVTGREADNWYEKLTINKGSKDGITENMAVVDQNGLLGKTINVTENTSEVLLIIDSGTSLGGMLQESSIEGILQGIGGGKGLITMTKLPYNANIQLNDIVVTSGVGGIFPAGILVGTVAKVNTSSDGLSKEAVIQPYSDFDDIKFVLVVRPMTEEESVKAQNGGNINDTAEDGDENSSSQSGSSNSEDEDESE